MISTYYYTQFDRICKYLFEKKEEGQACLPLFCCVFNQLLNPLCVQNEILAAGFAGERNAACIVEIPAVKLVACLCGSCNVDCIAYLRGNTLNKGTVIGKIVLAVCKSKGNLTGNCLWKLPNNLVDGCHGLASGSLVIEGEQLAVGKLNGRSVTPVGSVGGRIQTVGENDLAGPGQAAVIAQACTNTKGLILVSFLIVNGAAGYGVNVETAITVGHNHNTAAMFNHVRGRFLYKCNLVHLLRSTDDEDFGGEAITFGDETDEAEAPMDPRWEGLKKIINN